MNGGGIGMVIELMYRDIPQLEINVGLPYVTSRWLTDNPIPIIPRTIWPENINSDNYEEWITSRVPDRTRADIDLIMKRYDMPFWYPMGFIKKDHGVSVTDYLWMRIDGEDLCYDDVRVR